MPYPNNYFEAEEDKSDLSEMEALSPTLEDAPAATLENVMLFATRSTAIDAELEVFKEQIAALTSEQKDIEENKLPGVLIALGMTDFGMKDGSKIKVEAAFQGTVAVKDPVQRDLQIAWLIANEGQDLVKNTITLSFGRGQDAEAKALCAILLEYGFTYEMSEAVHAGSLGSFIKEKMTNGEEVPLDKLKWRYFNKATIKASAKKRKKKGEL